ncbi:MAG: hypothetical protein WCW13_03060 [archaeon]|jgi:hypothetical protein
MDFFIDGFGVIGLVILLVAFILNVRKRTRHRVFLYNSLQFVGASILCLYAFVTNSMVFTILEGVWALIAVYFIYEFSYEEKLKHKK